MPGPPPAPLVVPPPQRTLLEHLAQGRTGPHYLAQRARLLLLAVAGLSNRSYAVAENFRVVTPGAVPHLALPCLISCRARRGFDQ